MNRVMSKSKIIRGEIMDKEKRRHIISSLEELKKSKGKELTLREIVDYAELIYDEFELNTILDNGKIKVENLKRYLNEEK